VVVSEKPYLKVHNPDLVDNIIYELAGYTCNDSAAYINRVLSFGKVVEDE
jgi:hypothetical protein